MKALPRILKETHEDPEITKYRLYSAFMDDWFERQEKKVQEAGKLPKNDIKEYFIEYSLALAKKMDEKQVSHISPKGDFAPFFAETEEIQLAKMGCPLTKIGEDYTLLHNSLHHYFLARSHYEEGVEIQTRKPLRPKHLSLDQKKTNST
jgi:hypothetical protein